MHKVQSHRGKVDPIYECTVCILIVSHALRKAHLLARTSKIAINFFMLFGHFKASNKGPLQKMEKRFYCMLLISEFVA